MSKNELAFFCMLCRSHKYKTNDISSVRVTVFARIICSSRMRHFFEGRLVMNLSYFEVEFVSKAEVALRA